MPTLTRDEWLGHAARAIRDVRPYLFTRPERFRPIASFPRTSGRTVRLGEIVPGSAATDTLPHILVSPAVSDPLEVTTVLAYYYLRFSANPWRTNHTRVTRQERTYLASLGFAEPYDRIVPTDQTVHVLQPVAEALVNSFGTYPEVAIDPAAGRTAARQTTRMLRASCGGDELGSHDVYILRISQAQADRGLPFCGVCSSRMSL